MVIWRSVVCKCHKTIHWSQDFACLTSFLWNSATAILFLTLFRDGGFFESKHPAHSDTCFTLGRFWTCVWRQQKKPKKLVPQYQQKNTTPVVVLITLFLENTWRYYGSISIKIYALNRFDTFGCCDWASSCISRLFDTIFSPGRMKTGKVGQKSLDRDVRAAVRCLSCAHHTKAFWFKAIKQAVAHRTGLQSNPAQDWTKTVLSLILRWSLSCFCSCTRSAVQF